MESWMWVVIGIAALVLLFLLYRFFKKRFDTGKYVIKEEERLHVTLESTDFAKVALIVIEGLGGVENIKDLSSDGGRLKVGILRYEDVNEKKIRSSGVGGVLRPSKNAVQIIVGENAESLKDEMESHLKDKA